MEKEKTIQSYEVITVFSLTEGEDAAKALNERFQKLITDNGEIIGEVEEWGKRRLAYPINDEVDGYYVLTRFKADTDFPTELNRVFMITDGCLRSIIVRIDEVA